MTEGMAEGMNVSRDTILYLPIEKVHPNPAQARKTFEQSALNDLAESIRAHGIQDPLWVKSNGEGEYLLIAGERRYRAAQLIGLHEVPALLKDGDADILSLLENIQRENLEPLEEAAGLQKLLDAGETQETLARKLGKNRSYIAQKVRLLKLPECAKTAMIVDFKGKLSESGARQIMRLSIMDKVATKEALIFGSHMASYADNILWGPNYARSVREIQNLVDDRLTTLYFALITPEKELEYELERLNKAFEIYLNIARGIPEEEKREKLPAHYDRLLGKWSYHVAATYSLLKPDKSRLTDNDEKDLFCSMERFFKEYLRTHPEWKEDGGAI